MASQAGVNHNIHKYAEDSYKVRFNDWPVFYDTLIFLSFEKIKSNADTTKDDEGGNNKVSL